MTEARVSFKDQNISLLPSIPAIEEVKNQSLISDRDHLTDDPGIGVCNWELEI